MIPVFSTSWDSLLGNSMPFFPKRWSVHPFIFNKMQSHRSDNVLLKMRTDIHNHAETQTHSITALRGGVMESLLPSFHTIRPACCQELHTALGYFRFRTALYTLGQRLPFSLHRLPPILFSQDHLISHTPHGVCISGLMWLYCAIPQKMEMVSTHTACTIKYNMSFICRGDFCLNCGGLLFLSPT